MRLRFYINSLKSVLGFFLTQAAAWQNGAREERIGDGCCDADLRRGQMCLN